MLRTIRKSFVTLFWVLFACYLGAHLLVRFDWVKRLAEAEIGDAYQAEVKIEKLRLRPLFGLRLTGLEMRAVSTPESAGVPTAPGALILQAEKAVLSRCHGARFLRLFKGVLDVSQLMDAEKPVVAGSDGTLSPEGILKLFRELSAKSVGWYDVKNFRFLQTSADGAVRLEYDVKEWQKKPLPLCGEPRAYQVRYVTGTCLAKRGAQVEQALEAVSGRYASVAETKILWDLNVPEAPQAVPETATEKTEAAAPKSEPTVERSVKEEPAKPEPATEKAAESISAKVDPTVEMPKAEKAVTPAPAVETPVKEAPKAEAPKVPAEPKAEPAAEVSLVETTTISNTPPVVMTEQK